MLLIFPTKPFKFHEASDLSQLWPGTVWKLSILVRLMTCVVTVGCNENLGMLEVLPRSSFCWTNCTIHLVSQRSVQNGLTSPSQYAAPRLIDKFWSPGREATMSIASCFVHFWSQRLNAFTSIESLTCCHSFFQSCFKLQRTGLEYFCNIWEWS